MDRMKDRIDNYAWRHNGRTLRIGIGGGWFGRDTEVTMATLNRDRDFLLNCYDAGFRYFDTSNSYGESELVYGAFIKEIDRKDIFIATKSWYLSFPEGVNFERFKANFYSSFKRLGVDKIDLFQIHDTNDYSVCCEKVIPFLEDRKREGMIDYIGFGMRNLVSLEQAIVSGRVDSVLQFFDYSLPKGSASKTIGLARKHGVCYINASILLYGRLIDTSPPDGLYGVRRRLREQILELRALCAELGVDPVTASYQLSLFNPDIDMLLVGINNDDELTRFLEIMETHIYPEQWAAIERMRTGFENFDIQDEMT